MARLLLPLLLAITTLSACEGQGGGTGGTGGQGGGTGGAGGAGGCRDSSVCQQGTEGCYGPNDPYCGAAPDVECMADADCMPGSVCHSIADYCSPDGVGSRCGAPCAADADCDPDFTCSAGGSCAPAACGPAGVTCMSWQVCDASSIDPAAPAPDRTNGCQRTDCQSDDACAEGLVCVNGYCQTGFGACKGLPP